MEWANRKLLKWCKMHLLTLLSANESEISLFAHISLLFKGYINLNFCSWKLIKGLTNGEHKNSENHCLVRGTNGGNWLISSLLVPQGVLWWNFFEKPKPVLYKIMQRLDWRNHLSKETNSLLRITGKVTCNYSRRILMFSVEENL